MHMLDIILIVSHLGVYVR